MSEQENRVNKDGWLWLAPQYFNQWRIFPRAFIIFYFWLCFETATWFMDMPDPSGSQAAFAGAIISAGAAWFGLYVHSGTGRPVAYLPQGSVNNYGQMDMPQPDRARREQYPDETQRRAPDDQIRG